MPFAHPTEVEYPATREGYRDRNALHSSIQLNAGFLTCRSCHAGSDPKKHFLLEHSGLANICGYCHVTGIRCPGEPGDLKSECYPGRLKGGVRCAWGETVELFEHTSGFCVNCHGSLQAMSAFHKVEIDYPSHRKGFKPLAELDDEIKLEDGRVTCESCHLKIDEGFAVCSECHPK